MAKKRHKKTRQERLNQAKKDLHKTLHKVGYFKSKARYDGYVVPFPDLSVESRCSPTTNIIAPTIGKREQHPDAKQFPVGNNHKQGLELILRKEDVQFMNGRKY